jgi:hypothetical protein
MRTPYFVFAAAVMLAAAHFATRGAGTQAPPNTWTQVAHDPQGARTSSSFRWVEEGGYFLLWGFHGYVMSDYGNPEKPWSGNKEYDLVAFDPRRGSWDSHLPFEKEEEWRRALPPMHMCSYYQGITIGSHRPQLKDREGVLRPDLNVVFDQLAYDRRRARMIWFTGGRTFAYDVKARKWSDAAAQGGPPPVLGGSLCYDRRNDEMVLFGGGHVAEPGPGGVPVGYTGTWIYESAGSRWRPLDAAVQPPPRLCARLVEDPKNGALVVFGGDSHKDYLADTWIYDTRKRQWRQSRAPGGPPPRAGHFAVYDPGTGWVIIGGGYNRQDLTDMWAYDAARDRWMKLRGEVPTGFYVAADIAPKDGLIVLTTSTKRPGDRMRCNEIYPVRTTWQYRVRKDGLVDPAVTAAPQRSMPKRSAEEAALGTQPDPRRRAAQAERIRTMPSNQWVLLDGAGRVAPLRTWGSCSFDTDRNRIVYWGGGHCGYGGADYDFYDVAENTWTVSPAAGEFPEKNWDKSGGVYPAGLMTSGAPFMRHGRKCYAYDPVSRKIVNMKYIFLTAGYEPAFLKGFAPLKPDFGSGENFRQSGYNKWVTWTFDPSTEKWEILCPTEPGLDLLVTTPKGVVGVNYYWERVDAADNGVYRLDVAGRKWNRLNEPGARPRNLYETSSLVYDSRRDQIILHGGGPQRDELWRFRLSGGQWEKLEPEFAPGAGAKPPVCLREAVYIPGEDAVLTSGMPAGTKEDPALWAYRVAENRWHKLSIPAPPGRRAADLSGWNRAWAYDAAHDVVLMVLGERAGDDARAQVFALRYRHAP